MMPDDDDAENDLPGIEQRLAVHDHVADARGRADQFCHDDIGPGPAQHQAQGFGNARRSARDEHTPHDAAAARTQGIGRLDQVVHAARRPP